MIHGGSVTESFTISTRVRQGCLLSPLLFLIIIDWVTKAAFNTPRGSRWTVTKRLEDLDFADDICMLAHRLQDAQEQLDHLQYSGLRAGLKINVSKTKTMRVNACLNNNIMLSGQAIEDVNEFTYLGSIVSPRVVLRKTYKLEGRSTTGFRNAAPSLELQTSSYQEKALDI